MDENVMQEVLDEVFSALESLETQNGAILQFLKKRGVARDEDFAPFLEVAAKASNVRWRATRIRMNQLLSNAFKANGRSQGASAPAAEKNNDQNAAQQPPEGHTNPEQRERTVEGTEPDSRAERDSGALQQKSDSNQKAEESAVEKPAKDAA
jgi:hypothetical protein